LKRSDRCTLYLKIIEKATCITLLPLWGSSTIRCPRRWEVRILDLNKDQIIDLVPGECKKTGKILASFVDPRQSFGPDKIIPPEVLARAKVCYPEARDMIWS